MSALAARLAEDDQARAAAPVPRAHFEKTGLVSNAELTRYVVENNLLG